MSKVTGRVTIVADDLSEYNVLYQRALDGPPYTLVSSNEPTLTLVVDLTEA